MEPDEQVGDGHGPEFRQGESVDCEAKGIGLEALAAAGGHCAPTLQRIHQRVALGASPGVRGGRLCSQRCAVACEADKIAIVANGGAPNGPFLHCSGDSDGHLMPLSPAVSVR